MGGLALTVVHERTGLLVPVGDWHAFAHAIIRVSGAPTLCDAFGHASVQHAQTYAWPRVAERAWPSAIGNSIIALDAKQRATSCGLAASGERGAVRVWLLPGRKPRR